jgi:hypothetical protein
MRLSECRTGREDLLESWMWLSSKVVEIDGSWTLWSRPLSFWRRSAPGEWAMSQLALSAESRCLSGGSAGVRERVSPFERMLLLSVSGLEMAELDMRRES